MSALGTVTARCVHCMWRTDLEDDGLQQARDLHELIHPGGTVLVGDAAAQSEVAEIMDEVEEALRPREKPADNGAPGRDEAIAAIQAWATAHGHPPTQRDAGQELPTLWRLKTLFGSFSEAIVAAGFEKPTRGGSRGQAMPPPAAKPKRQSKRREPAQVTPEPAPVLALQAPKEGTLVELAQAVEQADDEWGEAIAVMEAAQERYEDAKARLAETIKVLAERVGAA